MIRAAIVQPSLPHYRMPVFNMLGARPDIRLTVFAGENEGGLFDDARTELEFTLCSAAMETRKGLFGERMSQPAIANIVSGGEYDVVVLSWNARNSSVWKGVRAARRRGIPVLLWGHGYSKSPSKLRDWLRDRLGRSADGVILYSRSVANSLIQHHGYCKDCVFVAPNAIDQIPIQRARQHWLDRSDDLASFQRDHGLDPARTVIFVSRLFQENGLDLLIEAMARPAMAKAGIRVIIVGDGPARGDIEQHARNAGVADRMTWTGAVYDEMDLAPWMLSSTLFCYPRNIGLSILHAFGYGLPVVTGDDIASHNPEIEAMSDGKNGLLACANDSASFAERVSMIVEDTEFRRRLSEHALSTAQNEYTLENMICGFQSALITMAKSGENQSGVPV